MGTVRYTVLDREVITEKRSGIRREYVPDPLGSTAALLDSSQTATDSFSYWPYGEEQARAGSTQTPFEFVGTLGYYRDGASRTYVRARYLNTPQGRWMTQDPIGFGGGDGNLYRYVDNNPTTSVDSRGTSKSFNLQCWIQAYMHYVRLGISPSIARMLAARLCGGSPVDCSNPPPVPPPPVPPPHCPSLKCSPFMGGCAGSCPGDGTCNRVDDPDDPSNYYCSCDY